MKEPPGRLAATDQGKRDPKCLMDVINLTDIAIRRIIQMAKQIAAFKRLCQEDQIALLKGNCLPYIGFPFYFNFIVFLGGCIELMILRGVVIL